MKKKIIELIEAIIISVVFVGVLTVTAYFEYPH